MHDRATVAEALRLRDEEGLGAVRVANRLGLPIGTVRDWHAGRLPKHSRVRTPDAVCSRCGNDRHDFGSLSAAYVYLLGLYLGDGCISEARRGVYRLRIFLDLKYPEVIEECVSAIGQVLPANKINRQYRGGSYLDREEPSNVQISAYSKSLPCLFPQHGRGKKHERRIWLARWQQQLAERWPGQILRGLIHSDGCRFTNTPRQRRHLVGAAVWVRQPLNGHHQHLLHRVRPNRPSLDRGLPRRSTQGGDDLCVTEGRRRADGRVHRPEALTPRVPRPNRST